MMKSMTDLVWCNLVIWPKNCDSISKRHKLLWRTCSNWEVLDNISYAIATTISVLDPSTKPLHGFWSHHFKYHEWISISPFEKPTQLGWNHQIYACQLWAPYSKNVENPKGSGRNEYSHNGNVGGCLHWALPT